MNCEIFNFFRGQRRQRKAWWWWTGAKPSDIVAMRYASSERVDSCIDALGECVVEHQAKPPNLPEQISERPPGTSVFIVIESDKRST